ncbi:MAG: hypothetical protein Kow00108_07210 [Calditrichia bacterium]
MKKRSFLQFILLFFLIQSAQAVGLQPASNTFDGFKMILFSNDYYASSSAVLHPAASINRSGYSLSLGYNRPYNIPELYYTYVNISMPFIKQSRINAQIQQLGSDIYSESALHLSAAFALSDNFTLGISNETFYTYVKNYPSYFLSGFSLDMAYQFSEKLHVYLQSSHLFSVGQHQYGTFAKGLLMGINYRVLPKIQTGITYYQKESRNPEIYFFVHHSIKEKIGLFFSTDVYNNRMNAGASLKLTTFTIGYGLFIHPALDESHSIEISYSW